MKFNGMIAGIVQAVVNIDSGYTTIEPNSLVYNALKAFCDMIVHDEIVLNQSGFDVELERERVISAGLREDLRKVQQHLAKAYDAIERAHAVLSSETIGKAMIAKPQLSVGSRVIRNMGPRGTVTGFRENKIVIRWDGASQDQAYTDGEIDVLGIVKTLCVTCDLESE